MYLCLVALVGEGKGRVRVQVRGFKIAGSVRVRRSKPYGNSSAKLYDYDAFSRPPNIVICVLWVLMLFMGRSRRMRAACFTWIMLAFRGPHLPGASDSPYISVGDPRGGVRLREYARL